MQVDEVEVEIDPKDIELSTARSGGAGGELGWILMNLSILYSHVGFSSLHCYDIDFIDEHMCRSECE